MVYELYSISGSPYAWAAMLGLEIKGLTYQSNRLDPSKGEHKSEHYLAMNPHGKVPVLKDNENNIIIYESLAILAYLDRKHPATPLFGTTAQETALIWQRIFELINYEWPPVQSGVIQAIRNGEPVDERLSVKAHAMFSWIESLLIGTPYLAGQSVSGTDVVFTPFVQSLLRELSKTEAEPLQLGRLTYGNTYPHLESWVERIEAIAGYERTYPVHWRSQNR